MINFTLDPATLIVRAGTTVTWVNNDGTVGHTTTSDTGVWGRGLFSGGDTFSFTFDQPGIYPYLLQGKPHGRGIPGTIIVIP